MNRLLDFYRSGVGKKTIVAVTGIVLAGYVLIHMLGNLKLYEGPDAMNLYAEWLRGWGTPSLPREGFLWAARTVLLISVTLHIVAIAQLTVMNRRARPDGYAHRRRNMVTNIAALTMRSSGIFLAVFIVYHLLDLTFGVANPDYRQGDVYHNVVVSLDRVGISLFYIAAQLVLGLHLIHGMWSLFQTLGWNQPGVNDWRRRFAWLYTGVVVVGNLSFPLAVQLGYVSL